jgi:hypothetical protein
MDDSEASLLSEDAIDETEKELKNNLPPWESASISQRFLIILMKLIIFIPLFTVLGLIFGLFILYTIFYIYPICNHQMENLPEVYFFHSDSEQRSACIRACILLSLLLLLVTCTLISLFKASVTDPGKIPDTAEWEIVIEDFSESSSENFTTEKRKDGLLRTCKYCLVKKPDRCHHCKQCDRCNLKMDHHCNWIINCVGNNNYKFFFLTIFYSALSLGLFVGSFWESVVIYLLNPEVPTSISLFLMTSYSLTVLLTIGIFFFLGFHFWLISENFTTIEYCEKKRARVEKFNNSPYSSGVLNNFKEALGENPWMWFVPCSSYHPVCNGLFFNSKVKN